VEGFERFVERLPALRDELSEATWQPAAFTWFLRIDPQVAEGWGSATWGAEKYADVLSDLTASGDELALHTHLWRWDSQAGDWLTTRIRPGRSTASRWVSTGSRRRSGEYALCTEASISSGAARCSRSWRHAECTSI
jgi:hypothetical protein